MREVEILLAEDNRSDVFLVREALALHRIPHHLHVTTDGQEAVDFIRRMGKPGGPACPDLLLLDLNLPKVDGSEILREFRQHAACAATPVVIFSSSDAPSDRQKVEPFGITLYFAKPSNLDDFMHLGAIVKEVITGES